MLPFYYIHYYVPDYRLYYGWGAAENGGRLSADGYSSLFIDIFRIYGQHPIRLHILSLILMTLSILLINAAVLKLLKRYGTVIRLIMACGTFAWGQWYYFCGKLVWSYPFALVLFAFAFYVLSHIIDEKFPLCKPRNQAISRCYYLFFFLIGFSLSWQTYFIFPIFGLVVLMVIYKLPQGKANFNNPLQYLSFAGCFFGGFIAGNYHMLTDFSEWLKGIRSVSPASNGIRFAEFFIRRDFTGMVWDQVMNADFNTGVVFIGSLLLILLISLSYLKNKLYSALYILVTALFCVFLNHISTGFQPHGFGMGVFYLVFLAFCVKELFEHEPFRRKAEAAVILVVLVAMQAFNNFAYYIPHEYAMQKSVHLGIETAIQNEAEIFDQISGWIQAQNLRDEEAAFEMNIKRVACYIADSGIAAFRYPFTDARFFAYRGGDAVYAAYRGGDAKARLILQIKPDIGGMDMAPNGMGSFIKKYWEQMDRMNDYDGSGKDLIFENDDYAIWGN
jgi:hypothetical protein